MRSSQGDASGMQFKQPRTSVEGGHGSGVILQPELADDPADDPLPAADTAAAEDGDIFGDWDDDDIQI